MRKDTEQERNIGLDSANPELDESTEHLAARDFEGGATRGAFDEKTVVVRSDLRSSESGGSVETNTVAACRFVNLDFARVGLEVGSRIFGRDTALNRVAALRDGVLSQSKIGQRSSSSDLNLGSDNIDTSDFFGDCMLDLNTSCNPNVSFRWIRGLGRLTVDFDEVVALCVDQELALSQG